MLRGPQWPELRSRPIVASIPSSFSSSSRGDNEVRTLATMLRKSGCSMPPSGPDRYKPDVAVTSTPSICRNSSSAASSCRTGLPRLLPSPTKAISDRSAAGIFRHRAAEAAAGVCDRAGARHRAVCYAPGGSFPGLHDSGTGRLSRNPLAARRTVLRQSTAP